MPDGRIVTPSIEDAEAMQGFPRGWTKPAETVGRSGMRWKLVGNAVSVPTVRWIADRLARPGNIILRRAKPLPRGSKWPRAAFNVGSGRFSNDLSRYPKHVTGAPLHEFLAPGHAPLSRRATAGFLERTTRSSLRFPPGFLEAVRAHLRQFEHEEA